MKKEYNFKSIESNIQKYWEENKIFKVKEEKNRKKFYCLSMLPYPSGNLHIGHVRNYTIGDVISRFYRMLGKNVLNPIGWDAFGLPAEEAAIKNNTSAKIWTKKNISYMKKQLKKLGFSFDWSREINTSKKEYFIWEQWFFIQLYKKKLVYKKKSLVNWCPTDKTVLANEQVINKRCWRCNSEIKLKNMYQWFIKITKYAEELSDDLNSLNDWPKKVKKMQKNWIGKSKGMEIIFNVYNKSSKISVYTTRIETLMGTTCILLSYKHDFVKKYLNKNLNIINFIKSHHLDKDKYLYKKNEKIGINTNEIAINPINQEKIQIWIVNFIYSDYGTGAAICVPAHNKNDLEFALKYNIPIKKVLLKNDNKNKLKKTDESILCNSGEFNGLSSTKANKIISKKIIKMNKGKKRIFFKLKDWCISRQRYWGTPIPMGVIDNKKITYVPENKLPITLNTKSYNKKKLCNNNIIINDKKNIILEKDTFDTFIASSWYYARYTCPKFTKGMLNPKKTSYWLPVDLYIGGIEHAIMHLLYFRFYHKLMRDFKLVKGNEPVKKLLCQGMVLSDAFYYTTKKGEQKWIKKNDALITYNKSGKIKNAYLKNTKQKLIHVGMTKMSKSKNNGVNPNEIIKKYGSDTLRLFVIFAAPIENNLEWNEAGIRGMSRFLKKIWRITYNYINQKIEKKIECNNKKNEIKEINKIQQKLHETIKKVSEDIKNKNSLNTAISSIMKFTNKISEINLITNKNNSLIKESIISIIKMLYPFAPHFSCALWKEIQGDYNIEDHKWPVLNKKLLVCNKYLIIIQINGKTRRKIKINKNFTKEDIFNKIKKDKLVDKYIENKKIKKIIFIPKKIINIVIY
ncbi:leucine--tRNA ligase [Buchnera aphidicola (Neophyllaphis varicolor)]|uniref:leucine--tRNA ligase n=1 Tax=Buchnera aphidicola TaxID=9 RepID=UPI0031B81EF1